MWAWGFNMDRIEYGFAVTTVTGFSVLLGALMLIG
jgi:hypothetical protein